MRKALEIMNLDIVVSSAKEVGDGITHVIKTTDLKGPLKTIAHTMRVAGDTITTGLNQANVNSPIPQALVDECNKCAEIVTKFSRNFPESESIAKFASQNVYLEQLHRMIPQKVLQSCKGIAILSVIKAGAALSGRAGSGIVMARLKNGDWSAPSAIGLAGLGFGLQFGASVSDYIFVLNTDAAVEAFYSPNLTLGTSIAVAAGPFGRAAEMAGEVSQLAPIFSYSYSQGLYIGASLEGAVILERSDANAMLYRERVGARSILNGYAARPPEAAPLYQALRYAENAEISAF
jgi:lipid-binding SYLF domain-containing protein